MRQVVLDHIDDPVHPELFLSRRYSSGVSGLVLPHPSPFDVVE